MKFVSQTTDILFCGDAHGRLEKIVEAALRRRPMAVVLLGDIESPRPLHLELAPIIDLVWWVCGNHDTDNARSWSHLVDSDMAERRLDGRVVTLPDGTRLAGLGGVFRQDAWYPPAEPRFASYDEWHASLRAGSPQREEINGTQRLKHRSTIFPAEYLALARQRADILVTHEAGASHPSGFDAIDELASAMGVHTTFHGHHHDRLEYSAQWEQLGFRCHGVGLRGISNRAGEVVVPGHLDAARMSRGSQR